MVAAGIVADSRSKSDGFIMRRFIVIAAAGFSLAGCSSFSMGDYFKSTPPTVQVQLELAAAGRRCPHLDRTELQDPLLGHAADHVGYDRLFGQL